jgi:EAL domain-containing protein (putative c-di-GMP-specific phosphodiesterase class I)
VLEETGLEPRRLVLEVTEADLIRDTEATIACLDALRATGARIAIDDFGTGHSSLSRLRDFPVDVLKIDKSFTALLTGADQSIGFAHAVFSFGVSLGLHVVAEGVETLEHLERLEELHCEWGQGFYFSRPLRPEVMRSLLDPPMPLPAAPRGVARKEAAFA